MSHLTSEEILNIVSKAKEQVEEGALYFHYKDASKHYKVLAVGMLEENEEVCVVYQALYGSNTVWVRKLEVWLSTVAVNGADVPRFQKVK